MFSAENAQIQTPWRDRDDMPPFSADVRKSVPLPRAPRGLLDGVQSIKIENFQDYVFGEHFNRCQDRRSPPRRNH